jgi:uncharacterized protein DUF6602
MEGQLMMDLEGIFNDVSDQMRKDFTKAQKALKHSGLKGSANEEAVRQFLRQYFPKTIEISSGVIVDAKGGQSRQLDIILNDAANTPIFFQSADTRVIPVECTYAVIEVKAYLDKSELEKAYQNMKSVKVLSKIGFFKPVSPIKHTHNLYGKKWSYWPVHHFVFAYDSPGIESVLINLNSLQEKDEVHNRIDTVCVLDKGVILNQGSDGIFSCLPTPGSVLKVSLTTKPLLFFYTLTSLILNQASMNPFSILPYLDKIKF